MSLAIGFTNVYYTLWSVRVDGVYSDDGRLMGNNITSTYLKNLSKDKDQAIAKAKELGATDLVPDNSLKGYKNFTYYQPTEEEKQRRKDLEKQQELDRKENIKTKFIKGKYVGKTFEEVNEIDADYLWWYMGQLNGINEDDKLIESVLRNKFEWIRERHDEILRIRKFKDGKHFKEKEKVEISVEVLFDSESWEGRYGTTYKYLLGYDTDKELTYLGSKDLGLNKGDIVTLKGTIKHKQYGTDMYETRIQRVKVVEEKEEPKTNPKSELEKALKGIEIAIELSGETKDLLKAKEGIEMAMGLSKPSLTKRQKLEQDLKNESVKIWFEKKDNTTRQTNKKFLSISELTDVELNRLRNDIIIYGIKKGILSDNKGRTVFLNWELTTKNPKYKIYYLTENGTEKALFFDNKKDALKEIMLLNKVDSFNNYTLLNISEWNKDYEDYINFKTPHTINRM